MELNHYTTYYFFFKQENKDLSGETVKCYNIAIIRNGRVFGPVCLRFMEADLL